MQQIYLQHLVFFAKKKFVSEMEFGNSVGAWRTTGSAAVVSDVGGGDWGVCLVQCPAGWVVADGGLGDGEALGLTAYYSQDS